MVLHVSSGKANFINHPQNNHGMMGFNNRPQSWSVALDLPHYYWEVYSGIRYIDDLFFRIYPLKNGDFPQPC